MASTHLSRTSVSPTNALKFTYSFWVKLSALENDTFLLDFNTDGNNRSNIGFETASKQFIVYEKVSGSTHQIVATSRLFKDPSAWMHIVVSCDKTLATASDRTKIYVNGSRVTSLSQTTYPAQNTTGIINTAVSTLIGKYSQGSLYLDGSLTHIHFIDGTAYDADDFGETDSTSGIWTPKTAPSVTYGNNGFFLKMENSGAMGTDSSGNSNTFTVNGTLTQNVDTPDNNFATYNPLDNYYANSTFTNGNTTVATNTSNTTYNTTTLGIPSTMKCYWEVKFNSLHSANGEVGIVDEPTVGSSAGANRLYYQSFGISVNDYGQIWSNNSNTNITLGTLTTSDIVCFAWDGINQALYVRKNGDAWINSGDPTSGASKTGTVKSFTGTRTMFPAVGDQAGNHSVSTSTNFGNGFFGTTAISSEGTNASGFGKFEHDVPTGYQSLSTKGLNA